MMLYRAKNRERGDLDRKLDRWFLLASLFAPLGLFLLRTQPRLAALPGMDGLKVAALRGYAILGGAWLLRQGQKLRSGAEMNWPKVALMAGVVPLQWLGSDSAPGLDRRGSCKRPFRWVCFTACNITA